LHGDDRGLLTRLNSAAVVHLSQAWRQQQSGKEQSRKKKQ
jgi:hypothetical protein